MDVSQPFLVWSTTQSPISVDLIVSIRTSDGKIRMAFALFWRDESQRLEDGKALTIAESGHGEDAREDALVVAVDEAEKFHISYVVLLVVRNPYRFCECSHSKS